MWSASILDNRANRTVLDPDQTRPPTRVPALCARIAFGPRLGWGGGALISGARCSAAGAQPPPMQQGRGAVISAFGASRCACSFQSLRSLRSRGSPSPLPAVRSRGAAVRATASRFWIAGWRGPAIRMVGRLGKNELVFLLVCMDASNIKLCYYKLLRRSVWVPHPHHINQDVRRHSPQWLRYPGSVRTQNRIHDCQCEAVVRTAVLTSQFDG
jgi:hypothetical protein